MAFVTLTKEQFAQFANERWGEDRWEFTSPKRGRELVIRHLTGVYGIEQHIYTTVEPGDENSRKKGADAIRVVTFDTHAGQPLAGAQAKRVHRTASEDSDPFIRITERLDESDEIIKRMKDTKRFCRKPSCRFPCHTVERSNRSTGEKFFGCAGYGSCGDPEKLNKKYGLQGGKFKKIIELQQSGEDVAPAIETPPAGLNQAPPKEVTGEVVTMEANQNTGNADLPTFNKGLEDSRFNIEFNRTPVHCRMLDIVDEDKLTPCSDYPHQQYPFPTFNRVQSVITEHSLWNADVNLVAGTTTSSGKTVVAQLAMGETLARGQKVLYVSPLKSLTQEKFDDWTKFYGEQGYKICILTGDYILTDERAKEMMEADIICLTSEMVDSRTRNYQSEKSEWISHVGLVVVDEMHIIATNRGHAVEVGLLRFSQLNPAARLWVLSATLPNVGHFQTWLTKLNGKRTEVINSSWRPVTLDWHFIQHPVVGGYFEIEEAKMARALDRINAIPDEKFLVFVHAKSTGRSLARMFTEEGIECKFHNADLGQSERMEIESSFAQRDGGLRVLISTSTLAWGRTLPARNVIIVGTTRGMNDVDELDIIQMGGRSGRAGVDPKGDVWFIMDNERKWQQILENPRYVNSTLLNEEVLGFHILAEVKNNEIFNWPTLVAWFDRTLAKLQVKEIPEQFLAKVLHQLMEWKMLRLDHRNFFVLTALGRISATLYFMPQDVYHWAYSFSRINDFNQWESDIALAWAIGGQPSQQLPYIPRAEQDEVEVYFNHLRRVIPGVNAKPQLHPAHMYGLISGNGSSPYIRNMQNDIDRVVQALTWLDGCFKWNQNEVWQTLGLRVKYGAPRHLAQLTRLPGVGAKRAAKLFTSGIKSISDVLNNKAKVQRVVGANRIDAVMAAARTFEAQKSRPPA